MSSLYSRLRTVFNPPNVTTITKPSAIQKKDVRLQKMVDKFKKLSESPDFRTQHKLYSSIVRRLSVAKKFSMVEDFVEHQKKFEDIRQEGFTVRLIGLYGKAGMFSNARKLFDEMTDLNCTRTVHSFNALISACIDAREFDKVEGIVRDLSVESGITPNVVSFNTVVKGYCEMGNLDSAVLVLEEMENRGIEPDVITFNTLLNGFYASRRFDDGEKVWALMESKNVVPNVRSYNSRLRGLVLKDRVIDAVEYLGEMESKGIKPDVISYNAVIKGFCNDGNVEEVKDWYRKLVEDGCGPDRVTYLMVITFLRQNGDLDMALQLCIEIMNKGWLVNVLLFQQVLDDLVKLLRVEDAKKFVELGKLNKHHYKLRLA